MSRVYQKFKRANGLALTAWMKNQNIVAMNISFLKTRRDSIGFYTAEQLKKPGR